MPRHKKNQGRGFKNRRLAKKHLIDLPIASVSTPAAAEILDVSVRTMEEWRRTGAGPQFVRYSSRCLRYRIRELEKFQEERLVSNTIEAARLAV